MANSHVTVIRADGELLNEETDEDVYDFRADHKTSALLYAQATPTQLKEEKSWQYLKVQELR